MEIIKYSDQQAKKLDEFKASVWPVADKEHYDDNEPDFFRETITLLAMENETILGYITVIVDSGVAQIEPLMVAVNRKGQGIGSALLKAAEDKVQSLGVHKVWLETGSDWAAKTFYEKHGYTIRTTLPNHTGRREFVLMDKMI